MGWRMPLSPLSNLKTARARLLRRRVFYKTRTVGDCIRNAPLLYIYGKSGTEVPLFLIIENSSKQTLSGIIWFFFGLNSLAQWCSSRPLATLGGLWLAPKLLPKVYFVTFVFTYVKYATPRKTQIDSRATPHLAPTGSLLRNAQTRFACFLPRASRFLVQKPMSVLSRKIM